MATGLRERKKLRTKATIAEAALDLFIEQGFDGTTVAEIADAAEVSPRTFFSYFASKEDVICAELDADLEALRTRLEARQPGESALEALEAWILALIADPDFSIERKTRRRRLIRETPALRAYEVAHVDTRFQEILAAAVADDLGCEPTELTPRMVAAAASAALRAMVDYLTEGDELDAPEELLEEAIRFLRTGMEALVDGSAAKLTSGRQVPPDR